MDDTQAALNRIEERYRTRFAGHPRGSRDPDDLEALVTELDTLAGQPADDATKARISTAHAAYTKELAAIRDALAVPFAAAATRLRTWSDLSMSRYQRSFAGQDRRTRDVALLEEITDDLSAIGTAMTAVHAEAPVHRLGDMLANIERVLPLYRTEIDNIRAARKTGSLPEQGSRLADLANAQFARYTMLFAKQSRLSRHPRTLERILAGLEDIRRAMQSLKLSGFINANNDQNIVLVDERLRAFRKELTAIRETQNKQSLSERVSSLATAANELFSSYRDHFSGKPREQAEPSLLNQLFERLWPIAREMDLLDDTVALSDKDEETNARNLRIVTDNLTLYAREYDAIRTARGESGPRPAAPPAS